MDEQKKAAAAKKVYDTVCRALDNRDWTYEKEEEKLTVCFGVNGDDLPMDLIIAVDTDRQLLRLLSPLPFKFSEDKRVEGAIATCAASYVLADGSFDYDLSDGSIIFRMTAAFQQSEIGEMLIQYLISSSCAIIDQYNDKFLAIDKGVLKIAAFLAEQNK